MCKDSESGLVEAAHTGYEVFCSCYHCSDSYRVFLGFHQPCLLVSTGQSDENITLYIVLPIVCVLVFVVIIFVVIFIVRYRRSRSVFNTLITLSP